MRPSATVRRVLYAAATLIVSPFLGMDAAAQQPMTYSRPFQPEASAGLFVGVREFFDGERRTAANVTPVEYAVDDAVDLAHLFVAELGLIAPSRAVLALSGEPQKPQSRQRLRDLVGQGAVVTTAYQTDLHRHIQQARERVEENGLLVISFATHGLADGGGLLYAADTDPNYRRTGINVVDLQDEIALARSARRIVLLDACRVITTNSNARSSGVSASRAFAEAMRSASGTAVIMGTKTGGRSYDDDERRNGVFTASFIAALTQDPIVREDGLLTLGEIVESTDARVRDWVLGNVSDPASAGIHAAADQIALEIPLRADPVRREQIASERERLLTRLRTERDPTIVTDRMIAQVQMSLQSLSVAAAHPLMLRLEVFANSGGGPAARSKAFADFFLAWTQPASVAAADPADIARDPAAANLDSVFRAARERVAALAQAQADSADEVALAARAGRPADLPRLLRDVVAFELVTAARPADCEGRFTSAHFLCGSVGVEPTAGLYGRLQLARLTRTVPSLPVPLGRCELHGSQGRLRAFELIAAEEPSGGAGLVGYAGGVQPAHGLAWGGGDGALPAGEYWAVCAIDGKEFESSRYTLDNAMLPPGNVELSAGRRASVGTVSIAIEGGDDATATVPADGRVQVSLATPRRPDGTLTLSFEILLASPGELTPAPRIHCTVSDLLARGSPKIEAVGDRGWRVQHTFMLLNQRWRAGSYGGDCSLRSGLPLFAFDLTLR